MASAQCTTCPQPSVYACSCRTPPLPFCQPCSHQHHATPGNHIWAELRTIDIAVNRACEICQLQIAEMVCCCDFPVAFVCTKCRNEHLSKHSTAFHMFQPVEKAALITCREDIDNTRKVIEKKNQIVGYLKRNTEAADKLKSEVVAYADEVIAYVNKEKDQVLKLIREFEERVERKSATLSNEVDKNLFSKQPACSDQLSQMAFQWDVPFAETTVFSGSVNKKHTSEKLLQGVRVPEVLQLGEAFQPVCSVNQGMQGWNQAGSGYQMAAQQPVASAASSFQPISNPAAYQTQISTYEQGKSISPQQCGDFKQSPQIRYGVPQTQLQGCPASQMMSLPAVAQMSLQSNPSVAQNHLDITQQAIAGFHSPSREDFNSSTPEIPITIGRHRLPIQSLQSEFKWNQLMVAKFQEISQRYPTWRRCRGDGNCFYRCLGVLLCEHFCRPDTPMSEFQSIVEKMIGQSDHFQLQTDNPEVLSSLKLWIRLLKDLYNTRVNRENAFQKLQYYLQKTTIDRAIIIAMRHYTATYLHLHSSDGDIAVFVEDISALRRDILEYGKEAEGVALMVTARTFNVILRIVTIDNKSGNVTERVYGPQMQGWYPSLHILHLPGHYNILTPRDCDAVDRYDFASNTYNTTEPTGRLTIYEEYRPES